MTAHSSLDELNQAIKESNPFESNFVAKSYHVWDEDFLDLPNLHANASEAVLEAVQKINLGNLKSKTVGFAILAPKGVGKTHVLSRIRQQVKRKGEGFFIYMCEYGNLSLIKNQFLQSLALSLKKVGSKEVMQWQELATALINRGMGRSTEPQQLIEQFPRAIAKNPNVVNLLTQKVLPEFPDIDNPYIVKAILWTLSQAHAPFAVNWLAGRELSEAQAKMMDLPDLSKENRDIEAFNTACQILALISYYTTPVICFDELDGSELADETDPMLAGYSRAQVVGSLAKDIYNNLKRGVLITAMYAQTWREDFQAAGFQAGGFVNAAKDRIAHKEVALSLLKPDDVVMLVAYWLEDFYSKQGLTPPHAVYPFEENQLRDLGDGATVRDILQWCAQNFSPVVADPNKRLEKIYQQIEEGLEDFSDDNERIANAIAFGLQHLQGQIVEGVLIKDLEREVNPVRKHHGFINFKVIGEEKGKEVRIGVCILQNSNGNSVRAAIKYLTWYDDFNLTRGCLIRSKAIPLHWRVANVHLQDLLTQKGGEWISFRDDEIKPLLAIHKLFRELDRNTFSSEDFQRFICEKHPIANNSLIREIMSDPSGQSPVEVIDEDGELEELFSQGLANLSDNTEEPDGLDILSVV